MSKKKLSQEIAATCHYVRSLLDSITEAYEEDSLSVAENEASILASVVLELVGDLRYALGVKAGEKKCKKDKKKATCK